MNELIAHIVEVCHRLYAKGFVSATDGNVSARLENGNVLTTVTSVNKGMVTPDDVVEVDQNGRPCAGDRQPSTEIGMHLYIYARRPDVAAIVHAHPVYATGFAAARQGLDACVFPEVIVGLGAIPIAEYATPSTGEVASSLAAYVERADAILLANHGAVTYGKDLYDAYFKMEKVEHAAHITFIARMLGGERLLSQEQVEKLRAISYQTYGKELSDRIGCGTGESSPGRSEEELRALVRQMIEKS